MAKQRLNNKGFVLVEVLIVVMIISLMLLTNLAIYNNTKVLNFYNDEDKLLVMKLNNAKQLALNSKSIVNIKFHENTFIVYSDKYSEKNTFHNLFFQTSKELYFNKTGNLNQGYTILFKKGLTYHKLIFYIGKGWFKIE